MTDEIAFLVSLIVTHRAFMDFVLIMCPLMIFKGDFVSGSEFTYVAFKLFYFVMSRHMSPEAAQSSGSVATHCACVWFSNSMDFS